VSKFEKRVTQWLAMDDPGLLRRTIDYFWFFRFNKGLANITFWGMVGWVSRFATTASAPAIMHFVYKRVTLFEALIASLALFILFSINSFVERWLQRKSSIVEAASAETWVRIGDLISSVKSSATPAAERDGSITATLGVIEGYARKVTRSPKGDISVSLALYDGRSTSSMKIKHRNPGNERPIGRTVKQLDKVLGHIACRDGHARVVNDLKYFGRDAMFSPTHSSLNYRSMLLVPITSTREDRVKGFISIDCATPYGFYGNRGKELVVICEPLIDHIQEQC